MFFFEGGGGFEPKCRCYHAENGEGRGEIVKMEVFIQMKTLEKDYKKIPKMTHSGMWYGVWVHLYFLSCLLKSPTVVLLLH